MSTVEFSLAVIAITVAVRQHYARSATGASSLATSAEASVGAHRLLEGMAVWAVLGVPPVRGTVWRVWVWPVFPEAGSVSAPPGQPSSDSEGSEDSLEVAIAEAVDAQERDLKRSRMM